jgi:hypothetical protein
MKTNIKRVKISFDFNGMTDDEFLSNADGTVTGLTGNPKFTAPLIPLSTVTTQIGDARTTMGLINAGQTTRANTLLLEEQIYKVKLSVVTNGHYVEDTANELAAGDAVYTKELILTTGYKPEKDKTFSPRDFEVVKTGIGWAHIRTTKTKKGPEVVQWEYGITPAKDLPPVTLIRHINNKVDIVLTDLPSGSIVGIRRAPAELASKVKRHDAYSHLAGENIAWSEFIYFVVP